MDVWFPHVCKMCIFKTYFYCKGEREAAVPNSDQLPGSQQPDGGDLHAVHPGQPDSQREGWREGEQKSF